jgi:hypothetical protein
VIASTKFRIGGAARNRTGDGRFAGPSPVVFASRSFELSRPKSHLLNRLRRSLAPAHRGCRWLKLGAVGPWRAQFGHSSTSALIKFDHSAVTPYCALGRRNASIVKISGTTIFLDPQTGHAPDIASVLLGFRLIKHPWNGVRMEFQLHKRHVLQTRQRWRVRAA